MLVLSLKPGKSDTPNEYKRKSNECTELLNSLRNKGNQEHNCQVLESQEGELMLLRRPQGDGPFSLQLLWMDGRFSQTRMFVLEKSEHTSRGSLKTKSETLVGKHKDASELLWNEVFPKMLSDHTSFVAKNDPIIVGLRNLWMKRKREEQAETGKLHKSKDAECCQAPRMLEKDGFVMRNNVGLSDPSKD